jgi:glycosyltransferase involved in cell wall biosynthesis
VAAEALEPAHEVTWTGLPEVPVTVVIPAYDRARLVGRALSSIARQRPALAAEVIVVDDGSTDDTAQTAERAGARVVRHERNRGLAAARNTGLAEATHPWVAFLDSDDEWLPHHLATLWGMRRGHVLVAASALRCGPEQSSDRLHGCVSRRPTVLRSPAQLVFPDNFVPVSAAMVRRDPALAAGGFEPRFAGVEDFDLWMRLLDGGAGVVSPVVTLIYHVHTEQMSGDHHAMHAAHIAAAGIHRGRSWWSPGLVERWRGRSEWDKLLLALRARDRRRAIDHAATIASHPQRVLGLLRTWARRLMVRRRSSTVARDGGPSVALLPGTPRAELRALERFGNRPLVDLRALASFGRAWVHLLRRPTGLAVTYSPLQACLVRLIGVRALKAREKDTAGFVRS